MATAIVKNIYFTKLRFYQKYAHCIQRQSSSCDFLYSLIRRGVVKDIFPKEHPINCPGTPCAYAGFDATADSLHVGNLLVVIALLHWQQQGFKSILLLGDSTAEIGDPSGHNTDRKILSRETIKHNADGIENNLKTVIQNYENFILPKYHKKSSLQQFRILRNSEWYESTSIVDFISTAGRNIRIGEMLSRTSVKTRVENGTGMNFSEFSYQVFQSYDWLYLLKKHNCYFQFGGSDQLGNIISGYNMISASQYQQVYGCLLPLVTSETGDKFGKSAGNAVYLSPDRTSPFDFYQFYMRVPDADVEKFLKLFTFLSLKDIENTVKDHMKNPDQRKGQRKLAEEVTLLVHGEDGLKLAENATKILYHSNLESLAKLKTSDLKQIFPLSTVAHVIYEPGMCLLDLSMKIGCFLTEADAKRIISSGGLSLNFEKINSTNVIIIPDKHILPNNISLVRIGKKNYYFVVWK